MQTNHDTSKTSTTSQKPMFYSGDTDKTSIEARIAAARGELADAQSMGSCNGWGWGN